MFFRETELGTAGSYARVQPGRGADDAGKICACAKVLRQRCGMAGTYAVCSRLLPASYYRSCLRPSVRARKHPSSRRYAENCRGLGFELHSQVSSACDFCPKKDLWSWSWSWRRAWSQYSPSRQELHPSVECNKKRCPAAKAAKVVPTSSPCQWSRARAQRRAHSCMRVCVRDMWTQNRKAHT